MKWETIKEYIPEIVFALVIVAFFIPIEVEMGIVFFGAIIVFAFCPDKRRRFFNKDLEDYSDCPLSDIDRVSDRTRQMIKRNRQHRIEDGDREEIDEYGFIEKDEPFYEYTQNYDDKEN